MRRRPRNTAKLSEPVQHRLNLYALSATAAGVGLLALAQAAEAKVVYTKAHQVIHGQYFTFNLDLNHDGIVDFQLYTFSATDGFGQALYISPYVNGNSVWHSTKQFGVEWALALPAGVRIGPRGHRSKLQSVSRVFMAGRGCNTTKCSYSGNWFGVGNRYLGLSFLINGKTHYGWARLIVGVVKHDRCCDNATALLTGYAYETIPGKAIITGETKGKDDGTVEPASLGHLAKGASAIPIWRQKAY